MPYHINEARITRLPDWEVRLADWLRRVRHESFCWGRFDCALACADVLAVITGQDFASAWRGQYHSDKGAFKALLKRGYRDVYQAMSGALGQQPTTDLATLGRGDIGGAVVDGDKTVGIIWAERLWLPDDEGLRPHALSLMVCGWKVGGMPCLR